MMTVRSQPCQGVIRRDGERAGGTRRRSFGGPVTWLLLVGAILSEVTATVSLKLSDGLSKLVPTIVVAVGYVVAFVLLAQALKRGIPLGVAYGVWAAAGVALVAIIGAVFLHEPLAPVQVVGLVLVGGGVLLLELGARHT
jgi:small multidrug resistance pump